MDSGLWRPGIARLLPSIDGALLQGKVVQHVGLVLLGEREGDACMRQQLLHQRHQLMHQSLRHAARRMHVGKVST